MRIRGMIGRAAAAVLLLAAVWWAWRVGARHDEVRYLVDGQRLGEQGRMVYLAHLRVLLDTVSGQGIRTASSVLPMAVLLPGLVGAVAWLLGVLTGRRAWNLRFGWAAVGERPLVVGGLTVLMTAAMLLAIAVLALLQAGSSRLPVGLYFQAVIFADHDLTVTFAVTIAALVLIMLFAGPSAVDRVLVGLRTVVRLRGIQRRYGSLESEEAKRDMLDAFEEFAVRPYRPLLWVSLAIRDAVGDEIGDADDEQLTAGVLRTVLAMPGLPESTVLGRLLPVPGRLRNQFMIANSLLHEFDRTGAFPYLEVAVRIVEGLYNRPPLLGATSWRQAVGLVLAWLLGRRHDADPAADGSDLRRALELARGVGGDHPEEVAVVLGPLEYRRFQEEGDPELLDRAITLLRSSTLPMELATALTHRHDLSGDPADLDEALGLVRSVLADRETKPVERANAALAIMHDRFRSPDLAEPVSEQETEGLLALVDGLPDHAWRPKQVAALLRMNQAGQRDDDEEMLDHLEHALLLAVGAASLGLGFRDRRRVLGRDSALAPQDAADIALTVRRPERAVELLELGRTVIWSQARALREVALELPEGSAARAERLRAELDRSGYGPDPDSAPGLLTAHRRASQRTELAREWERLTDGRLIGGRPDFDALRRAAAAGPVVVLNLSQYDSTAVIVLADREPIPVRLPRLRRDEARMWADVLPAGGMNVRGIARRLWDTTAAPVLEAVEPYLGPDRRLWWCTTDALTAIPMHLAADHGQALLDHVVSSYTPSLATLIAARERAVARKGGGGALTVSVSRTRHRRADGGSWEPLAGAAEEGSRIAGRYGGSGVWLADGEATVAAVGAALPGCDRAHFACHGDADGLVLHDGRLGFEELAELRVDGELAFLSACDTAAPDRLARDEILHPAAALHVRGFAEVVAAVWPVGDQDSAELTARFYDRLADGGSGSAAAALHAVQLELRAERPGDPGRWAAFSHFGC